MSGHDFDDESDSFDLELDDDDQLEDSYHENDKLKKLNKRRRLEDLLEQKRLRNELDDYEDLNGENKAYSENDDYY